MNKKEVDRLIPDAYILLKEVKIADNYNKISKTYRGHISALGAAITMGSLLSAIAYFSKSAESASTDADRTRIIQAIGKLIHEDDLMNYVIKNNTPATKDKIINAAIALKLAMNLYKLV